MKLGEHPARAARARTENPCRVRTSRRWSPTCCSLLAVSAALTIVICEVYDVTGQTSHFIGRCIRSGMTSRGPARTPGHDGIGTCRGSRRADALRIPGAHRRLLDHSMSRCLRRHPSVWLPVVVYASINPAIGLGHAHYRTTAPYTAETELTRVVWRRKPDDGSVPAKRDRSRRHAKGI